MNDTANTSEIVSDVLPSNVINSYDVSYISYINQ